MKGDFTRQTFRAIKRYSGVLMQQGRVQLDADWNEQQAINRHRSETAHADVIGPNGAPKTAPGFEISVTVQGQIQIGGGHFYVGGILCENHDDVLLTEQPDLRPIDGSLIPTEDGLYVAYLEAWERHITALEDEAIKESALAGPDTATRTKTVWQVRLLRVADPGGTVGCETAFPEWTQLLRRNLLEGAPVGRLNVRSQPEEPSPDPLCILPPGAGYRRLENQLYRVEVHRGGDRAQARFKWSRDNGTVASRIEPDANGAVVSGSVITVAELGKDGVLTFASDPLPEWLELTDDRFELHDQHGQLARVQAVDPATRQITFAPGALPALEAGEHPVVRRWDQRGTDATADGVAMTGDWQPLEDGVQVRFEDGSYREGDFWLVPARTAIGFETGTVEWPHDGVNPIAQPPEGTRHRLTRLALLRRAGGTFTLVPGTDCRRPFPPLTAIEATDVSFSDAAAQLDATNVQEAIDALAQRSGSICSLLVGPGEDLAVALNRVAAEQDALICLRAGMYTLAAPLQIENRRHVQIAGAGPGTRVMAPESEAALVFRNCSSVKVSNLHVETGRVGRGQPATQGLNGALSFVDCGAVTVEGASLRCAGGQLRAGTCVTVRRTAPLTGSRARIHACDMEVGHLQTGALLVNVDHIQVTDNVARAGGRLGDDALLQDADYRALLRPQLIAGTVAGPAGPPPNTNATVTFGGQVLHFRTDARLVGGDRNKSEWQRAINTLNPGGITSPRLLERFLLGLASDLLRSRGGGAGGSQSFTNVISSLLAQDTPAAGQALAVGGVQSSDIRVTGNSVRDAIQGIHVGVGHPDAAAAAGVVLIDGNNVRVSLPVSATRDRHGVYVGNADSVVVERNYVGVVRAGRNASLPAEGMRIVGTVGRRMIVRENHMGRQFAVGVTFAPLNPELPDAPLWIITENMMEGATTKVDVPQRGPGRPGAENPAQVRQRVRGIGENFA